MALRLITGQSFKQKPSVQISQKFKYLLLLDFEATCEKDVAIATPEIIEFPCMVLNTKRWKVENVFHKYVKPRINPILSAHCTDLTGIMQETIDDEQYFPEVFRQFDDWLTSNNYTNLGSSAFVTCGDWDLRVMLPGQCALDQLTVPDYFRQWINLKIAYYSATRYFPRSLKDMLRRLELPLHGRLHSGLHDTQNMAQIIRTLAQKHPVNFDLTSS